MRGRQVPMSIRQLRLPTLAAGALTPVHPRRAQGAAEVSEGCAKLRARGAYLLRRARAAVLGRARAPEAAACLLAGCPLPGRRPLAVAGGDRTYTRTTSGPAGVHPLMPSLSWRVGGAGFSGSPQPY